jgi:hypothetical protein
MSACLNCNRKLSCGCQKRTASDGKSVCSNCLSNYERNLKAGGVVIPAQKVTVFKSVPKK